MNVIDTNTVLVPAGSYILGDPCYTIPDNMWGDLLLNCGSFGCDGRGKPVGRITYNDVTYCVLGFFTAFGDGNYRGTDDLHYGVDSGIIGLVPLALAEQVNKRSVIQNSDLYSIITFDQPTICRSESGTLTFGHVVIDTRYEEDEEDEEDVEYDDGI